MKKCLLLVSCLLVISSSAMAIEDIGLYTDVQGGSCSFAVGFNSTGTIIHRSTTGATGSRFKVVFPAGSSFFSFSTPYPSIGNLTNDLSVGYGQCLFGFMALGTIVANLAPGSGSVQPADLQPSILYTNCLFDELPATGRPFIVGGGPDPCIYPIATQPSTWGSVKALYR